MILLRSLLYFVAFVIATLLFSLPIVLLYPVISFDAASKIAVGWGRTNLLLLRWICNLRYRIQGWDNIPNGPCIICSKHQSTWETLSLRGLLPHRQTWILKQELLRIPIFGWALRKAEPVAIERKEGLAAIKQVIQAGKDSLANGRMIVVFPEGTRVAPGERHKYGVGGALLAEVTGHPIIPIAHNAGVFWKRRGLIKYPGVIDVVVGPPILPQGRKAGQINKLMEDWIEQTMEQLPRTWEPETEAA